jgi:hypothetical protein
MRSQSELYRFHCENLRRVSTGMDRIAAASRRAIATSDSTTLTSLIRLYALLVGTWAECRLKKLLYEPSGFSNADRAVIRGGMPQYDKWCTTVELAFRKHYGVKNAELNSSSLPFTAAARYAESLKLLKTELRPLIELRNSFAHGQWAYFLTNDEEDVNTDQMSAFKKENLLTLQYKRDLLTHLADLVNDLVVSKAFDRDFDFHYKLIAHARDRLANQDYSEYEVRLRDRYSRGRRKMGVIERSGVTPKL